MKAKTMLDSKKIQDFPQLDHLDRTILGLLAQNGRMSNAELAEQVGLAQSTCLGRVRTLVQAGVIRSFTAEIAPEANRAKGTVQVKVQILEPDRFLTPELSATVDFLDAAK
jgi:DNA-binding Lrp family transcriptional regulator